MSSRLEDCCDDLSSQKITVRRRGCTTLDGLLRNEDFLKQIDKNPNDWTKLLSAMHTCITRDFEKKHENSKKRGLECSNTAVPIEESYQEFISIVNRQSLAVNFKPILHFIFRSLNDVRLHCPCLRLFLKILNEQFLQCTKRTTMLKMSDWNELIPLLRKLYNKIPDYNSLILQTLSLTIKLGPTYHLNSAILRDQYEYISNLFRNSKNLSENQQEFLLDALYWLYRHTFVDNRMNCCKLSEHVILNLLELYEDSVAADNKKLQLIEIFYIQVILHHPKNATELHPTAHANDWKIWKISLIRLYSILNREIETNLTIIKNRQIFHTIGRNIKEITPIFLRLYTRVFKQIHDLIDDATKRQKFENKLDILLENIIKTKSWIWIQIVASIIKLYPDLIKHSQYTTLLKSLAEIQSDCKDDCLQIHLNQIFYELGLLELNVCKSDTDYLWQSISKSIQKSYSNHDSHQKLLQLFIRKNLIDLDLLIENYKSETLEVDDSNLNTLIVLFNYAFNKLTKNHKNILINLMLHRLSPNFDHLITRKLYLLFFGLLSKQWINISYEIRTETQFYDKLEDIWCKTSLQELILVPNKEVISNEPILEINFQEFKEIYSEMITASDGINDLENLWNLITFIHYSIHYLHKYKAPMDIIKILYNYLGKYLEIFTNFFKTLPDKEKDEIFFKCLKMLKLILIVNVDSDASCAIRNLIPIDLLKFCFQLLNDDAIEKKFTTLDKYLEMKHFIMEVLVIYCALPGTKMSDVQEFALDCLTDLESYDFSTETDYGLVKNCLGLLKLAAPGYLSDKYLENIMAIIEALLKLEETNKSHILEILQIIYDFLPHVYASKIEELKTKSVKILYPFYNDKSNYGVDILEILLKCMDSLCQLDQKFDYTTWDDGEDIILKILDFLLSDYQEIRCFAIKIITKFFIGFTNQPDLHTFHRQEIVFHKLGLTSEKLFLINTNLTEEQKFDEMLTRSSTVLQIYASLIVQCNNWRNEAVFVLLQMAHDQKIKYLNCVLDLIAGHFRKTKIEFLSQYLPLIYWKWVSHDYNLNQLPFHLFACDNKIDLYRKYWTILAPLIIAYDKDDLNTIVVASDRSLKELLMDVLPQLFASILIEVTDSIQNVDTYRFVVNILNSKTIEIYIKEHCHEVLINLFEFFNDRQNYLEIFQECNILPQFHQKDLNCVQFNNTIKCLEEFIGIPKIILSLLLNEPNKIQRISLDFKMKIFGTDLIELKIKYLHSFTLFLGFIMRELEQATDMQEFVMRDSLYTLLQLLKHSDNFQLNLIVCRFFKYLLKQIFPKFSDIFQSYFTTVVITFKTLSQKDGLQKICEDILDYLLIENKTYFEDNLNKLKFNGDASESVEEEIRQFLEIVEEIDIDNCQENLVCLKRMLSEKKHEFKLFYQNAINQNRLLHDLIGTLIKMCSSSNKAVNYEAMGCLGEIGPVDLTTLVLKHETIIVYSELTPKELFAGHLVQLLTNYLIDKNVEIVQATVDILYEILNTIEGRKVLSFQCDFGAGSINRKYLMPFIFPIRANSKLDMKINENSTFPNITNSSSHSEWIIHLTCQICNIFFDSQFITKLIKLSKLRVNFCERILSQIIFILVQDPRLNNHLSEEINKFLDLHWNDYEMMKASLECVLNIIDFIRIQSSERNYNNLDIDYLKAAKVAQYCGAHFTAILYAELWCQQQVYNFEDNFSHFSKIKTITNQSDYEGKKIITNIFRKSYKAIGEIDALLACGTSFLREPQFRLEHYREIGNTNLVMYYEDMDNALFNYQTNMENFKSMTLWPEENTSSHAIRKANIEFDHFESKYTLELSKKLPEINLESCQNIYKLMTKMQMVNEFENYTQVFDGKNLDALLDKWRKHDDYIENDYEFIESIRLQRLYLLNEYRKQMKNKDDDLAKIYLDFIRLARNENHHHIACKAFGNLRLLDKFHDKEMSTKIVFEEAELCWSIGDCLTAKYIVEELQNDPDIPVRFRSLALKLTGQWMVESGSANRQDIIEDYFLKSIALLEGTQTSPEDQEVIIDTYYQLAKFADKQYQQIISHIKSDIFQKKVKNVELIKKTLDVKTKNLTLDDRKTMKINDKQSVIDENEIKNTEKEKNNFLEFTLKYNFLSLIHSDHHNMSIFRLISLLLENRANEAVKDNIIEFLLKIPTYKFIPVLPQMIPHISSEKSTNDPFTEYINRIVEMCAKAHPYHTLPLLLSLVYSNEDKKYIDSKAIMLESRITNAKTIIRKLKNSPKLSKIIEGMEQLTEALIELAYHKINVKSETRKHTIGNNLKIRLISHFDHVLLPTYNLPVDKTTMYNNIVGIYSFDKIYYTVGGINAPKRIQCYGTDGVKRLQLIKGKDDLRQDAVMQQVFTIMNDLLAVNKQTKNLRIRTYKITPLSLRSGILEWVDNSMTLCEYLMGNGNSGAHVKYRPNDKKPSSCMKEMEELSNLTPKLKLLKFKQIYKSIQPVFHKFFESTFPQASVWYEKRRAYINSVATSSMCGYILGLGDRHCSNILIDKTTAEVIHIDFGIAFEQGRVLTTPETVPFRLTRDIVDGMGVTGVEGVFRRSCEKTVQVLRLNSQTITTIVEVLLYDPLYGWIVSGHEAKRRQNGNHFMPQSPNTDDDNNKLNLTAERALLRLRAKLQGAEDGNQVSVEHQVESLIQQATDLANLCRLYAGWQPYL